MVGGPGEATSWPRQLLTAALAVGVVASVAAAAALPEWWCLLGVVAFGAPLIVLERRWRAAARPFSKQQLAAGRGDPAEPGAWFDWRLRHARRQGRDWDSLSWLSLRALVSSWNQLTVTKPMIHELRGRWDRLLDAQLGATSEGGGPRRIVDLPMAKNAFLIVGDTGEQDKSQYAVAPAIVSESDDVDFLVISSDVIYPAGGVNDYIDAVFRPYEGFEKRIFGLPGNHDWYDGLRGFMYHFCGLTGTPPSLIDTSSPLRFALSLTWRWPSKPKAMLLNAWRERLPSFQEGAPPQPGSYYAIDTGPLLVVCIDTGIGGDLDVRQGRWLEAVSALPKDKLLITGKPLVVNQKHAPCRIEWPGDEVHRFDTVSEIVRHPEHRYVATVGGDIHNHQTYEWQRGERPQWHFVSGGGGAFTSATHAIPPTEPPAPGETALLPTLRDCHPSRAASLQVYARRFVPRLWQLTLGLAAAWAGVLLAAAALAVLDPGFGDPERAAFTRSAEGWLVAGAVVTATWQALLYVGLGSRGREAFAPWRRHVSRAVAVVFGGTLAGVAWWLIGPGSWQVVAAFGAAGALAAGWAWFLRSGTLDVFQRRPKIETAVTLTLGVAAIGIGVWRLLATTPLGGGQLWAALLLLAALVVLPVPAIDLLQNLLRTKYQYAVVGVVALIAIGLVRLDSATGSATWVPEAVAAIAAVLAAAALVVVSAYAVFFGGLGLLRHRDAISGEFEHPGGLDEQQVAEQMLEWQEKVRGGEPADGIAAATPRNRTITHVAMLGKGAPDSAVLDKTSEIFDSDEPPFQKSYLRFAIEDAAGAHTLVIQGVTVTGEEPASDTEAQPARDRLGQLWEEPIRIPLAPPD